MCVLKILVAYGLKIAALKEQLCWWGWDFAQTDPWLSGFMLDRLNELIFRALKLLLITYTVPIINMIKTHVLGLPAIGLIGGERPFPQSLHRLWGEGTKGSVHDQGQSRTVHVWTACTICQTHIVSCHKITDPQLSLSCPDLQVHLPEGPREPVTINWFLRQR